MPGEFRGSQNWIGVSLKNAAFAPPHHEHLPDLMGDLERFLHGVEETARSSANDFRAVLDLKGRIERDALPRFSARRQDSAQALMRHLYGRPVIDIKAVSELTGNTTNTASALISDLVSFGVLFEITGQQRSRLFGFQEYIALFKR